MKILCTCEHLIIDQTDFLKHKGYLISDTQWFDFWDDIDAAIEKSGPSAKQKEAAAMHLRRQNIFKILYECTQCGKLYVSGEGNSLIAYTPDSGTYEGVLDKKEANTTGRSRN